MSIKTLGYSFDNLADTLAKREADIRDSLDEKETLLREIHHRVKNNLQIIISLLNMQERKSKNAHELGAITETRSRINAIALVHRGLYESNDLRYVNMEHFLKRLVNELSNALGMKAQNIRTDIVVDCEPMEADTATPVALFIVEALTNAVKHGVHNGGNIIISIIQKNDDVRVSILDDGKGFDAKKKHAVGTGTKLIKGFARQLGGKIDVRNDGAGYEVSMSLCLGNHTRRLIMLRYAITFFIIAIIAAYLGFSGIAGAASGIAQILFFVFLAIFVLSLVVNLVKGQKT